MDTKASEAGSALPSGLRRILFWGTYDLGKPRTRILRDGLEALGYEVTEVHADIWGGHQDKSQLKRGQMIFALLRMLLAYPKLIWRFLRAPKHDIVLVPYLGQFDVIVLWPFARLRGMPIVWDMFLSLYDTLVNDRRLATPSAPKAVCLRLIERLGCRAADLVLLDTPTHARYIERLFALLPGRAGAFPVGAERDAFKRLPPTEHHDGPSRLLFYGQMIPLHGIETILAAALSPRGRQRHWTLIGTGQEAGKVTAALGGDFVHHIDWRPWVPYDQLTVEIGRADICLGIFGTSEKAASVVPNKVYQTLLSGRPVITRDSPALREAFGGPHPGLRLVASGSADALMDAVELLERDGFPVLPEDQIAIATPADVARAFVAAVQRVQRGKTS
jgi:glycosyltransferase involved in cell wall biosynthesis